jgi:hypothetical protein
MGAVGPFLVAGLTVLLVMSLAAVIAGSPQDAVRSEPPVLNPPAAGPPSDIGYPASGGDAQVVTPSGAHRPEVRAGPPWPPAPRPPGLP